MPISPTLPFLRNEIPGEDAYSPERKVWVNESGTPEQRRYADYFYWPHFSILAQLPSVNIPCGVRDTLQVSDPSAISETLNVSEEQRSLCQVPVGLQLVGRPHSDAQLVDMAEEIHKVTAKAA